MVFMTEINERCFDGISNPTHYIIAGCLVNRFCWTKLSPVPKTDLFLDFVSSLVLDDRL